MALPEKLVLQFDGGCEPRNPGGVATFGWAVSDEHGEVIAEDAGVAYPMGHRMSTNNVAEWTALLMGLEWLVSVGWVGELEVVGDSMLVVMAVKGRWRCKAPHLKPLYRECLEALRTFKRYTATWVPREQNSYCDALSAKAYKDQCQRRGIAC